MLAHERGVSSKALGGCYSVISFQGQRTNTITAAAIIFMNSKHILEVIFFK